MKRLRFYIFLVLFSLFSALQAEEKSLLAILQDHFAEFKKQRPDLTPYSPEQIAEIANEWEVKAAASIDISSFRTISSQFIDSLLTYSEECQAKFFFQVDSRQRESDVLSTPPTDEGQNDHPAAISFLKKQEAVEWLGISIVLDYVGQKKGLTFCIQCAEDEEALGPTSALAAVLGTCAQPVAVWNDSFDFYTGNKPKKEILQMYKEGKLTWRENTIDALFGPGTFAKINQEMEEELLRPLCANTIFIAVTFNLQVSALTQLVNLHPKPINNLGLLVVTSCQSQLFPDGLFVEVKKP